MLALELVVMLRKLLQLKLQQVLTNPQQLLTDTSMQHDCAALLVAGSAVLCTLPPFEKLQGGNEQLLLLLLQLLAKVWQQLAGRVLRAACPAVWSTCTQSSVASSTNSSAAGSSN